MRSRLQVLMSQAAEHNNHAGPALLRAPLQRSSGLAAPDAAAAREEERRGRNLALPDRQAAYVWCADAGGGKDLQRKPLDGGVVNRLVVATVPVFTTGHCCY